ncbi:hypothetical protein BDW69DRAFT_49087 [Aspergillus filifer]
MWLTRPWTISAMMPVISGTDAVLALCRVMNLLLVSIPRTRKREKNTYRDPPNNHRSLLRSFLSGLSTSSLQTRCLRHSCREEERKDFPAVAAAACIHQALHTYPHLGPRSGNLRKDSRFPAARRI